MKLFPWLFVFLFSWLLGSKKKRPELDPANPRDYILGGHKVNVRTEINYIHEQAKLMHKNLENERLDSKVALRVISQIENSLRKLKEKIEDPTQEKLRERMNSRMRRE